MACTFVARHPRQGATIVNERLLEAVRNLAFFRTDEALARVNYRDMGTEGLGSVSVNESLLELQPVVDVSAAPWGFGFVGDGLSRERSRVSNIPSCHPNDAANGLDQACYITRFLED